MTPHLGLVYGLVEQAEGEQAECEQAEGEQAEGEQAEGEQAECKQAECYGNSRRESDSVLDLCLLYGGLQLDMRTKLIFRMKERGTVYTDVDESGPHSQVFIKASILNYLELS